MIVRHAQTFTALAITAILAGCTVFPDYEAPRVMDIPTPAAAQSDGSTEFDVTLRIDTPQATEPFDSSRILTKPAPHEYQIYGGVRWRDTAPVLLRELMIGTFRQEGQLQGVVNETSPTGSDVTLVSDLYGFHSETGENGVQVLVSLYVQLMNNRTKQTICTGNFRITADAAGPGIDQVVEAFGRGGEKLSQQLRDWLSDCLTV